MRTTQQLRELWGPPCAAKLTIVPLHSGNRISVAAASAEAWRALDQVMRSAGYDLRAGDTGAYNCRPITGGTAYSLHAFGIAADFNWNTNPYRKDGTVITDMPAAMVASIKAIRTTGGVPVFRWGGDFGKAKDPMHFEVVASPAELAAGIDWATVTGGAAGVPVAGTPSDPGRRPVLAPGDRGPAVVELQRRLSTAGCDPGPADGVFGERTEAAVRAFQAARGLTVDAVVGPRTWTALLSTQPATPVAR